MKNQRVFTVCMTGFMMGLVVLNSVKLARLRHKTQKKPLLSQDVKRSINLDYFDEEKFTRISREHPVNTSLCFKISKHELKSIYRICTHPSKSDEFVSGMIEAGNGWEIAISTFVASALQYYKAQGREVAFLDVGANIGTHALYGAKLGFRTWAVEPMDINAVLVRIIVLLSFVMDWYRYNPRCGV